MLQEEVTRYETLRRISISRWFGPVLLFDSMGCFCFGGTACCPCHWSLVHEEASETWLLHVVRVFWNQALQFPGLHHLAYLLSSWSYPSCNCEKTFPFGFITGRDLVTTWICLCVVLSHCRLALFWACHCLWPLLCVLVDKVAKRCRPVFYLLVGVD